MRSIVLALSTPLLAVLAAACASTPGANPHDMGVAEHQAMAAGDERAAASHGAQFDPSATDDTWRCGPGGGRGAGSVCWSGTRNPTLRHSEQEQQLRKEAADHRAASQALRDAETASCGGVEDSDRDISPFAHRDDIASVQTATGADGRSQGATVTFRPVAGLTAANLQRIVDCHLARNAALGHIVREMAWCPLVPNHVTASVGQGADGHLSVTILSTDSASAQDVLQRARMLQATQ